MGDGTTDDLKGRVKEAAGDLTDDQDLKQEGRADRVSGGVKDTIDDLADRLKHGVDRIRDVAKRD